MKTFIKISFILQNLFRNVREKIKNWKKFRQWEKCLLSVRKNLVVCEKIFLVKCCARKSYQSTLGKTEDQKI